MLLAAGFKDFHNNSKINNYCKENLNCACFYFSFPPNLLWPLYCMHKRKKNYDNFITHIMILMQVGKPAPLFYNYILSAKSSFV